MRLTFSILLIACLLTASACSTLKRPFKKELVKEGEAPKQVVQKVVSVNPEKIVTVSPIALEMVHVVKPAETLQKIAKLPQVYGDGRLWPVLFEANRKELYHPAKIYPGQKLIIPREQNEIFKLKKQAVSNKVYEMVGQKPPKVIEVTQPVKLVNPVQTSKTITTAKKAPTQPFAASAIRSSWTGAAEEKTSR